MDIKLWILLILIGVVSGLLSGMVGIGGGVVIVPALIIFLGFSQKMAQGTSLGVLLLPVGILGVMEYYKHGYIEVVMALIVSPGFLIGGYFGSKASLGLSQYILKKIFAIFIILIGIKMFFLDMTIVEKEPTQFTDTSNKKG